MKKKLRLKPLLSLPLYFCSLVFLDFTFRYFYRFLGDTRFLAWQPLVFTCAWALLLTALISLLPRLGRQIAMPVVQLFFALLCLVHGAMYNIFGHFFSFADMSFAGDGAKFFSWSYLNLRKAFLLCLVLSIAMMALAVTLTPRTKPLKERWKTMLAAVLIAALSFVPITLTHNAMLPEDDGGMWWGSSFNPNSKEQVYKDFTDPNRSLLMSGLYQYTFRNFAVSFGLGADRESIDRLDEYYQQRAGEISGKNERTGSLAGKNLIMVMIESLDTWMLTPEYTPNLYELQQNGLNFEHFYTPLYLSAGTFNTEIITQTGMIPANSGLQASAYSTNSFPLSLAHQFTAAGYSANSFHPASPSIYSRGSVHVNLGFAAYNNYVEMEMEDFRLDSQMMGGYDLIAPQKEPFYSFIITYSGHGPYNEELGMIAKPHYEQAKALAEQSGVTGSEADLEEYTRAIAHMMETDQFVGELVERLREDGRLEDTVLVFYGDHYGKYLTNKHFLNQIKGVTAEDPTELYHTPCFLYGGGLERETVEKYCSSVDLVPTLVNLFGLEAPRQYYAGDDIFGDRGGVVMLPNYAWYNGTVTYPDGWSGQPTEEVAAISAAVQQRMSSSMDALRCDYFTYWDQVE